MYICEVYTHQSYTNFEGNKVVVRVVHKFGEENRLAVSTIKRPPFAKEWSGLCCCKFWIAVEDNPGCKRPPPTYSCSSAMFQGGGALRMHELWKQYTSCARRLTKFEKMPAIGEGSHDPRGPQLLWLQTTTLLSLLSLLLSTIWRNPTTLLHGLRIFLHYFVYM